jgi:hypothetical protein
VEDAGALGCWQPGSATYLVDNRSYVN